MLSSCKDSQQERNSQTIKYSASEQWHTCNFNSLRRVGVASKSRNLSQTLSDNCAPPLTCDIHPRLSVSWAGHMTRPPCSCVPPAPSTTGRYNTPQTPANITGLRWLKWILHQKVAHFKVAQIQSDRALKRSDRFKFWLTGRSI